MFVNTRAFNSTKKLCMLQVYGSKLIAGKRGNRWEPTKLIDCHIHFAWWRFLINLLSRFLYLGSGLTSRKPVIFQNQMFLVSFQIYFQVLWHLDKEKVHEKIEQLCEFETSSHRSQSKFGSCGAIEKKFGQPFTLVVWDWKFYSWQI